MAEICCAGPFARLTSSTNGPPFLGSCQGEHPAPAGVQEEVRGSGRNVYASIQTQQHDSGSLEERVSAARAGVSAYMHACVYVLCPVCSLDL